MRAFTIAAVLLVLIVAVEGFEKPSELLLLKKFDKFTSRFNHLSSAKEKLMKRAQPKKKEEKATKKATARKFKNQQHYAKPGSEQAMRMPQHCNQNSTFYAAFQRIQTVCDRVDFDFMDREWYSLEKAHEAYAKLCATKCMGAVSAFLQMPHTADCLQSHYLDQFRGLAAMCQKDDNDKFCGAAIASTAIVKDHPCEKHTYYGRGLRNRYNRTRCETFDECYWEHTGRGMYASTDHGSWEYVKGECKRRVTASMLDEVCGSSCINVMYSAMGNEAANMMHLCSKEEDQYCAVAIVDFMLKYQLDDDDKSGSGSGNNNDKDDDHFMNATFFEEFCGEGVLHPCMLRFQSMEHASSISSVVRNYENCNREGNWWGYGEYTCDSNGWCSSYTRFQNESHREQFCMRKYMRETNELSRRYEETARVCAKSSEDYYCALLRDGDSSEKEAMECAMNLMNGSTTTCSSACDTALSAFVTKAGCCVNDQGSNYMGPWAAGDFPFYFNASNVPTMMMDDDKKDGANLTSLEACSSVVSPLATATAAGSCSTNGSASESLTLNIRINYANYSAQTDKVKASVMGVVARSIAAQIGIGPRGLFPTNIINDTDSMIGSSTFVFTLWGSTQALTDLAVAHFTALKTHGAVQFDWNANHRIRTYCPGCLYIFSPWDSLDVHHTANEAFVVSTAPADPCFVAEFFTMMQEMNVLCSNETETAAFNGQFYTAATAQAAWSLMCNGMCYKKVLEMRKSRFGQCLPKDFVMGLTMMATSCLTDDSDEGYLCGVSLSLGSIVDCGDGGDDWDRRQTETASVGGSYTSGSYGGSYGGSYSGSYGGNYGYIYRRAQCARKSHCNWNATSYECNEDVSKTTDLLNQVCNSGCVPKYAASLAAYDDEIALGATMLDSMWCAKDGNNLCYPRVVNEFDDDDFSPATNLALCTNSSKGRCYRKISNGMVSIVLAMSEKQFLRCLDSWGSWASPEYVMYHCLSNFHQALAMIDQFEARASNMCVKNADGNYCLGYHGYYAKSANACVRTATGGYCPINCGDEIDAVINEVGCCAGTLQEVYGYRTREQIIRLLGDEVVPEKVEEKELEFGDDDLSQRPQYTGWGTVAPTTMPSTTTSNTTEAETTTAATTDAPTPVPTLSLGDNETRVEIEDIKHGFIMNFARCYNSSFYNNKKILGVLGKKCTKVRAGTRVSRSLALGISWATLKDDPKTRARIARKLIADLAIKMGLSRDDFIEYDIVEDTSRTITVTADARRMSEQQTTSSTSKLEFTVQAQNAEDTEAAASSYDTAVSEGTMTLPSTTKTVQSECSNCTAGDNAGTLQSSANQVTVEAGSAGASAVTMMSAAVIALLLSLLL